MTQPIRLLLARTSLLVALALLVVGPLGAERAHAQDRPSIQERVLQDIYGPDRVGKDGPMAHVHTALVRLHHQYEAHRRTKGGPFRGEVHSANVVGETVIVEAVSLQAGALLADLERLGLENGARSGHLVSGRLPLAAIDEAAAIASLQTLRPALWGRGVGRVTTRGDSAMRADVARDAMGVNGSGVKTCALSDSYDMNDADSLDAVDDINSGDLPGAGNPNGFTTPIDLVEEADSNAFSTSDEGRAMLQIIHDVAPGSELGFHTAAGGQANFAQGIRQLANDANCDVIVDDIFYFAEPMFMDGEVAQAVSDVVDQGVAYFSSAGNNADRSYDTAEDSTPNVGFVDSGRDGSNEPASGLSGDLHDFDTTDSVDVYQEITVPSGVTLSMSLQWDDPFLSICGCFDSDTDIDLFVLNAAADSVLTSSQSSNLPGDAVEIVQFSNLGGEERTLNIAITRADGPPAGRMKYNIFSSAIQIEEHDTESPTAFGHSNARGAAAVAAAFWGNTAVFDDGTTTLNNFSSEGGIPILFDTDGTRKASPEVRRTPDFTAPDGANTTFFGQQINDGDDFPNFFGTSAAAPHAAAVAALMLSVDPSLAPSQVYQSMEDSAIDILQRTSATGEQPVAAGFDRFSGAGLIQASEAAPLPVEVADLRATASQDAVVLQWQTASETNNAGFRVEHSPPSAEDWTVRDGFVEGAGTTTEPQQYRLRIDGLAPGTHRFRLRQIDTDGTVNRSDAVSVRVDLSGAFRLTGVRPNPVTQTGRIRLTVDRPQQVRAELYNVLGQRVRVVHDGRVAASDPVTWTLDGAKLPSGVYFVRVEGETFSATRKFVRVR